MVTLLEIVNALTQQIGPGLTDGLDLYDKDQFR